MYNNINNYHVEMLLQVSIATKEVLRSCDKSASIVFSYCQSCCVPLSIYLKHLSMKSKIVYFSFNRVIVVNISCLFRIL